jgi:hypothetical protein
MFDADGEEMDLDDIENFYYQDAFDEKGINVGIDISSKNENFDLRQLSKITTRYTNRLDEEQKIVGGGGRLVKVPDNYSNKYGKVQYNLMKKLGYTGGDHDIIKSMDWGYRNYHRLKPNDQFSSSIILKSSPQGDYGDRDGRLRKKDVDVVIKELMRQLKSNRLKLDKKPIYRPDRNTPMIEFRVDPKQFDD